MLKGNASAWPSVLQPELQRRASRTPALMWILRGGRVSGGGVCLGRRGKRPQRTQQILTDSRRAHEKDGGNNSWRNCALHNKTRLRRLSDKAGSTLEKCERLKDKQGRG